jgi:D-sedoheptulose 7-phosphate isomerase
MNELVMNELGILLSNYPELQVCEKDIIAAFESMKTCHANDGLIMTCGNGGSAADAGHIVGELMKGFKLKRPLSEEQNKILKKNCPEESGYFAGNLQQAIRAVSLPDQISLTSAFVNDMAPDMVFAQQVLGYGKTGDVLIGLSTSGNSRNVVNACHVAKAFGINTIGMTGESGGKMNTVCDVIIRVPAFETYRIQEYHLPVYHTLCAMMEIYFFGTN